ncbi:zinc finger and BTB domain-containing protein 14-like isoform X2 [Macrobrachium rosenbergii]|uniref:zinc finger and BTB domain-containing protein 14-like isoform X2 n=1 Tax=Macrobrachium rosenbergii TaxID=79674 RepID=UPI0034D3C96C
MSSDGLLSLRWNNHHSSFMLALANLRNKENYSDITLACDGKFYSVHKIVLSTCSDYFVEILSRTPCKHPIIVLKDIRQQDLEALLNYMYLGEVNVVQNDLACLIKAAECLRIKGLAVPDEPGQHEEDSNNSEVKRASETKHRKRRHEENPLGAEAHPPIKKTSYTSSDDSVSSESGERVVYNDTSSYESPNKSTNEGFSESHSGEQNPPATDFVIKEETDVKYEDEDGIQLTDTDTNDNIENSAIESRCTPQRTKTSSESGELQFESSLGSEVTPDVLNPNIPQQYPLQPQTFEDIVSQAIPGPSLQSDGGHSWDSDHGKRDSAAFHLQGFPEKKSLLPNHHSTQSMGCLEETYQNMRGNIFRESSSAYWYAIEKQVVNDSRMDTDNSRHAREWRCMFPECGYVTDRESWLKQHFRKHTGERPFVCPYCSFRSAQRGNLNVHIKRVHLIDPASNVDDSSGRNSEKSNTVFPEVL